MSGLEWTTKFMLVCQPERERLEGKLESEKETSFLL